MLLLDPIPGKTVIGNGHLQVRLLTMAVDAVITVDDFLAVSEAHIVEDVKSAIQVCFPFMKMTD